jgi:amino acid transporter
MDTIEALAILGLLMFLFIVRMCALSAFSKMQAQNATPEKARRSWEGGWLIWSGFLLILIILAVVLLILKSAVELTIESIRSLGDEEVDLSRHGFWFTDQYEQFRHAQSRDWMLYLVERQGLQTRAELAVRVRQALNFNSIAALRYLVLAHAQHLVSRPKVHTYLALRSLNTP